MRKTVVLMMSLAALAGCDKEAGGDTGGVIGGEGVECEGGVCVLSGVITEDLTLTADIDWLLRGGVFIGDDENPATLTVEAGTTVYGETSTDGMLVIRRNAQIIAEGTAEAPIVFTSSKSPGSRARGDWGGLIINGKAPVNSCGEDYEGEVCEAYGEGGTGWYGGTDSADSSGVLRYVRVEFAGTLISPENELNGIAFQGVGSGTEVDYVQVHMNADDGVEFFGGNAEVKHVLVTGVGDDMMDWTDGWQGKAQYVVLQQYSDAGDNGFEADNNGDDNDAAPRSNPTLSNVTIIGSPGSDSSDLGMLLREGTAADISNVVVDGWGEACLDIDHDATFAQADGGSLVLSNVMLNCDTSFEEDDKGFSVEDFFNAGSGNSVADPQLGSPYDAAAPDYAPTSGSPATSGGAAPSDSFFDSVSFIGAMDAGDDWTAGWTTHEQN